MFDLSAIHQPALTYVGTVHGSSFSSIHCIVCFEACWLTLIQSSWTRLRHRSRKWMSGHAAIALAMRTIEDSSEPNPDKPLGEHFSAKSWEISVFP